MPQPQLTTPHVSLILTMHVQLPVKTPIAVNNRILFILSVPN